MAAFGEGLVDRALENKNVEMLIDLIMHGALVKEGEAKRVESSELKVAM